MILLKILLKMEMQKFVCKDFMFNKCKRENCKFNHIENVCFYFWKNGSCKFGVECKKSHEFIYNINKKDNVNNKNKIVKNKDKYNKKKVKNTECFVPMDKDLVDLRVVLDLRSNLNKNDSFPLLTSRDLLLSPNLFSDFSEFEIYNKLVSEIQNCGISENELLKMWHGNDKIDGTHLIADDHLNWKEHCPTFNMIIQRLKNSFKMDIKATRFNWYRDPKHWKAFHHDSSYINPNKALTQNFTVAISFGATKDAAFEHAKTKTVISSPQPDSTVYSFTNDTNGIWRHGILQDKREQELGRISIIAWGWIDNVKQIT